MIKHWSFNFILRLFPRRSTGHLNSEAFNVGSGLSTNFGPEPAVGQSRSKISTPNAIDGVGKAAESGNAVAQTNFGLMFASGEGVLKSNVEAGKWFRRAAEQGDAEAQFNLGNLCHPAGVAHLADEIAQARVEAYMWFYLAAAQGHSKAKASCEMLNLQMTDAELEEGNRRAGAFQPLKE
jgi:TPR repeat protein